jgi:hypothetical protein
MASMCAGYAILSSQRGAHTSCNRFLANVEMDKPRDLSLVKPFGDGLLKLAYSQHRAEQPASYHIVNPHGAS